MTYKSPRSDKIQPGRKGKEVVGVVYASRIVAKRIGVSRELVHKIMNATTDLWWEELLRGRWIKLGASGRVRVAPRGPFVMPHPDGSGEELSVPNTVTLSGTLTPRFKAAWYEIGGVRYVDDVADDLGDDEEPEWW
jgi:hypothetical protein